MSESDEFHVIEADEVHFDTRAIAAAIENSHEPLPIYAATAIIKEFSDDERREELNPGNAEIVDRDVLFFNDDGERIAFAEEKLAGVGDRDIAEKHSPAFIEIEGPHPEPEKDKVIAINMAHVTIYDEPRCMGEE